MTLNPSNSRQSNIELLRIVCMLFITFHHFISHGMAWGTHSGEVLYSQIFWGLNGFVYIGVNCFVLISGYFGIKFSIRKLLSLYLTCFFFYFCVGVLNFFFNGFAYWKLKELLLRCFLPISHSDAWFLCCYFLLMFLAPLLNMAMNSFDKKGYQVSLVLLSIINLYFGYYWKVDFSGNAHGFTLMQLVWMYFIGGYIRRYISLDMLHKRKWTLLGVYICCSIIYGMVSNLNISQPLPHWDGIYYHNPVLVISSIAFFCFFITSNINSSTINFMAVSSFGIYLAQSELNHYLNFYRRVGNWSFRLSGGYIAVEYLWALLAAVVFMFTIIVIDQIRKSATSPILKLYDKVFVQ